MMSQIAMAKMSTAIGKMMADQGIGPVEVASSAALRKRTPKRTPIVSSSLTFSR